MPLEVDPSQVHSIEVDPSQVQAAPASPQGSALQRFGQGLYDSTIAPMVQAVKHPVDTVVSGLENAIGIDDLHQAFAEYKKGNYGNAALLLGKNLSEGPQGRMVKATVQPIQQDIESGNYAGAAGRVVGTAATMAVPEKGVPIVTKAADTLGATKAADVLGDWLRDSATNQYTKVLAPAGKGDKLRAAEVAPQLVDRGVVATTRSALADRAAAEATAAGQKLDAAYDAAGPNASIKLKPILDTLEEAKQKYSVQTPDGQRQPLSPVYASAIKHVDEIGDTLSKIATPGSDGELVIPVKTARFLKGQYDQIAAQAGRYEGTNLSEQSQAEAHGIAADAIRQGIATNFPEIERANQEFKLWQDTKQVMDNTNLRKQGSEGRYFMPELTSAAAGSIAAHALGTAEGLLTAGTLEALQYAARTPLWRTVSSVFKDRLADAIQNGSKGPAQFYAAKIIQQLNAANAAAAPALPAGSSPAQ